MLQLVTYDNLLDFFFSIINLYKHPQSPWPRNPEALRQVISTWSGQLVVPDRWSLVALRKSIADNLVPRQYGLIIHILNVIVARADIERVSRHELALPTLAKIGR